jgi:hypothetical protein
MDAGNFGTKSVAIVNKSADLAASYQLFNSIETLYGSSNTLAHEFGGNRSSTFAGSSMDHGNFTSEMSSLADGKVANAMQWTDATQADHAWSGSFAVDSDGNMARSSAYAAMSGGDYSTRQNARARENASVYQRTNVTEALFGYAASRAVNQGGDRANTSVTASMNEGLFNNTMSVSSRDEDVIIYHKGDAAIATSASSNAFAEDSDGNKAKSSVNATMSEGRFDTVIGLEADGSASIYQKTGATLATSGQALTRGQSQEGDSGNTSVTGIMNSGYFNNTQWVDSEDENVSIYHKSDFTESLTGTSDAFARDDKGTLAQTSVHTTQTGGLFDTVIGLEADGSASIYQKTGATLATSGQALTRGQSQEGDSGNTSVTGIMNSGYFNNTQWVDSEDENVSIYHQTNVSLALSASASAMADDANGNKTWTDASATMNNGWFNATIMPEADGGTGIYEYVKASNILQGGASSYAWSGSQYRANTSVILLGGDGGSFVNDILAKANGDANLSHAWLAHGDSINASTYAEKPNEFSFINTTVSKNTVNAATLFGNQTAESNSSGTQTNQYITARGKVNSLVRSSSNGLTSNSDLNYNSVGVDSHLWAATNALSANSDRWTIFYLDDDVGDETIQSSVDKAFDHPYNYDTVRVFEGEYREHNIAVDKSLYIIGNGSTKTIVDAENLGRVFSIGTNSPSKDVFLEYMTIWNGTASTNLLGDAYGGGIYSNANLTLIGANVTGNKAIGASKNGTGGSAYGGGIYSKGNLTLIDPMINRNLVQGGNGYGQNATGTSGGNSGSGGDPSTTINITVSFSTTQGGNTIYLTMDDSVADGNYVGSYVDGIVDQWIAIYNAQHNTSLSSSNVKYYYNGEVHSLYESYNSTGHSAGADYGSGHYWNINYTALVGYNNQMNFTVASSSSDGSGGSSGKSDGGNGYDVTAETGTGGAAYGGGI